MSWGHVLNSNRECGTTRKTVPFVVYLPSDAEIVDNQLHSFPLAEEKERRNETNAKREGNEHGHGPDDKRPFLLITFLITQIDLPRAFALLVALVAKAVLSVSR